jgi:deoxyribodipyrimidine photolyase-related protein
MCMCSLNIIFPDQLSIRNEALQASSNEDLLLFYEPHDSFYEISHHKHKLVFQISALRHLINTVEDKNIKHEKISKKSPKLIEYLSGLKKEVHFTTINVSRPSDFKTLKDLMYFCQSSNVELNIYDDKNFITSPTDYQYWAKDKKSTTQEFYYRWLRKKINILMDDDSKPIGGNWNYDKENRQGISKLKSSIPKRSKIKTDQITLEVMIEVEQIFINSYGDLENFNWAVTHQDALNEFNNFLDRYLNNYGAFQDAINKDNAYMFHSLLSPYFNAGLLDPLACIQIIERKYHESNNSIPLNSVEGFIRQVLGWREFIMGVYWDNMPQYKQQNFWNHKKDLTESWYSGETGIPPLDGAIKESIDLGYTHHINRLMIISNLMNLSGIDPNNIYRWFMEMYVDTADWVMVPNVYGMGTFADGGIFSTKPYICGSSYMLRMSNYKKDDWCDVVDGLYWNFIEKNINFFKTNPRLSLMVNALNKINPERKKLISARAEEFIEKNTI